MKKNELPQTFLSDENKREQAINQRANTKKKEQWKEQTKQKKQQTTLGRAKIYLGENGHDFNKLQFFSEYALLSPEELKKAKKCCEDFVRNNKKKDQLGENDLKIDQNGFSKIAVALADPHFLDNFQDLKYLLSTSPIHFGQFLLGKGLNAVREDFAQGVMKVLPSLELPQNEEDWVLLGLSAIYLNQDLKISADQILQIVKFSLRNGTNNSVQGLLRWIFHQRVPLEGTDFIKSLTELQSKFAAEMQSIVDYVKMILNISPDIMECFPATIFWLTIPIIDALNSVGQSGIPQIFWGLPPFASHVCVSLICRSFDQNENRLKQFCLTLREFLHDARRLEDANVLDLLKDMEKAMVEQRNGFFGNLEKATTILENAQKNWKEQKILSFDKLTVEQLMSQDPQQQLILANRKPIFQKEVTGKENEWRRLVGEMAEMLKLDQKLLFSKEILPQIKEALLRTDYQQLLPEQQLAYNVAKQVDFAFFRCYCGSGKTLAIAIIAVLLVLTRKCKQVLVKYPNNSTKELALSMVRDFYNNSCIVLGQDIIYFDKEVEVKIGQDCGFVADEGDCVFDDYNFVKELKKFKVLYFFSASYISFHQHASQAIAKMPILNLSKDLRIVAKEQIIKCKREDQLLGKTLKAAVEKSKNNPLILLLTQQQIGELKQRKQHIRGLTDCSELQGLELQTTLEKVVKSGTGIILLSKEQGRCTDVPCPVQLHEKGGINAIVGFIPASTREYVQLKGRICRTFAPGICYFVILEHDDLHISLKNADLQEEADKNETLNLLWKDFGMPQLLQNKPEILSESEQGDVKDNFNRNQDDKKEGTQEKMAESQQEEENDGSEDLPICSQCQQKFEYIGKKVPKICIQCRKIQPKQVEEEKQDAVLGKKKTRSHIEQKNSQGKINQLFNLGLISAETTSPEIKNNKRTSKTQQKQESTLLVKERAQRKNVSNWMRSKNSDSDIKSSQVSGKFLKKTLSLPPKKQKK